MQMKSARLSGIALAALAFAAPPVSAQNQGEARVSVIQKLADCRQVAEAARRLACYDAAAAALDEAEAKGEVVVVDREQAHAVRKQAFGFSLPSLSLFDRAEKERAAPLDRLTATVARAYQNSGGKWVLELQDGATWVQTDAEPLGRGARAGSTAEIRKAALGSFFVNIDGQRAIRATRTR